MTKIQRAALIECMEAIHHMSGILSYDCDLSNFYHRMSIISNSMKGLINAVQAELVEGEE